MSEGKNPGYYWSKSEVAKAAKMHAAGASVADIAAAVGRTRQSVRHRLRRKSNSVDGAFKRGPWSTAEGEMLRSMAADGATNNDVAVAVGRTTAAVANRRAILKSGGWASPGQPVSWRSSSVEIVPDPDKYLRDIGMPRDYYRTGFWA